jgi:predicted nucleic acid-binding protein
MGPQVSVNTPRVYLDTNVFVAAFEHAGAHSDHAWWILEAIERREIVGATSELTLAEVLVTPLESGDGDLTAGYEKIISASPGFEVSSISREILVGAASLRARRKAIRLPDAIHIATAQSLACHFFVSNDRRLPLPEGLKLLAVNPFTLEGIFKETE